MGLQQATTISVVLFAAATFILWIPKIVVASSEYNFEIYRPSDKMSRSKAELSPRRKIEEKNSVDPSGNENKTENASLLEHKSGLCFELKWVILEFYENGSRFFLMNNGFPLFNSWKMKKNKKIIQVDLQHKPQPRDLNNFEGLLFDSQSENICLLVSRLLQKHSQIKNRFELIHCTHKCNCTAKKSWKTAAPRAFDFNFQFSSKVEPSRREIAL